jgi:hypothetical protein
MSGPGGFINGGEAGYISGEVAGQHDFIQEIKEEEEEEEEEDIYGFVYPV